MTDNEYKGWWFSVVIILCAWMLFAARWFFVEPIIQAIKDK